MLWVVLAMGILTHLPIRQVFKHARRLRYGEETPDRSSLCQARRRLGMPASQVFVYKFRVQQSLREEMGRLEAIEPDPGPGPVNEQG